MKSAALEAEINAQKIVDWLIDGAPSAPTSDVVLTQLCEQLVQADVPLWRSAVFVRTLHPEIMGRRFLWREGEKTAVDDAPYSTLDTATYHISPVNAVLLSGEPFRRRLPDAASAADMEILVSQQAQGATDYLAFSHALHRRQLTCRDLDDARAGRVQRGSAGYARSRGSGACPRRRDTRFAPDR